MAKYLVKGNYVGDGVAGLLKDGGTKRVAAATAAVESLGGSVDCLYYAFGDVDIWGIVDFDDDASATAMSLTINASGAVTVSIVPLMEASVIDDAASKSPTYSPPGT